MATIELQLDEQTIARARQFAATRHNTLEQLIEEIVEQLGSFPSANDPILGMFSDEPDLIDDVMADVMKSREERSLRLQSN